MPWWPLVISHFQPIKDRAFSAGISTSIYNFRIICVGKQFGSQCKKKEQVDATNSWPTFIYFMWTIEKLTRFTICFTNCTNMFSIQMTKWNGKNRKGKPTTERENQKYPKFANRWRNPKKNKNIQERNGMNVFWFEHAHQKSFHFCFLFKQCAHLYTH